MIVQVGVEVLSPKCLDCPYFHINDMMMEATALGEHSHYMHDFSCAELSRCKTIRHYISSNEGDNNYGK